MPSHLVAEDSKFPFLLQHQLTHFFSLLLFALLPVIVFMVLHWTHSNLSILFLQREAQNVMLCSSAV